MSLPHPPYSQSKGLWASFLEYQTPVLIPKLSFQWHILASDAAGDLKKKKRLLIFSVLCWTTFYLVVYHRPQDWWGTPSSHEMVSDTNRDWLKCRITPVSQLLKLSNAPTHRYPTENELLAWCQTLVDSHRYGGTTITKDCSTFLGDTDKQWSKQGAAQSILLNLTWQIHSGTCEKAQTPWEGSREFLGQRHLSSGDDIISMAHFLSDKNWGSERHD